jgi:pilus assembly protein Flp/PilA
MISAICSLYNKLSLPSLKKEEGQNMVEYALVVALIGFAATAGVKTLATKLNTAFSNIGTQVSSNIT